MKVAPRNINEIACKGAAFRLHTEYGIEEPAEIDLEALAFDKGVLVINDVLVGAEARLVRNASRGVIRVRSSAIEIGRRRFSIAHELGHWFLHPKFSQAFLCSTEDLRDYKNSPEEIEANIFAAELLMPTFLFKEAVNGREPSFEMVKEIASRFQTSLTATAIRIAEFSRSTIVIVASTRGKIRWWRPGRKTWGLWINAGQILHPESLACHLGAMDPHAGPEEVNPLAWLDDNAFARRTNVSEESLYFKEYGTVLTILTLAEADRDPNDSVDHYNRFNSTR